MIGRKHMKMKVESVPLASLKPYDNNAKKHTREQIEAVESSIREFGFRNPIIAWHNEDGVAEIVAGHARAKAAANIGMEEVPVVFCDDLTDAQRRALTLADNQTTIMTGWDEDMLAYELDTLAGEVDMSALGFDSEVTEDMFGDEFELSDADGPQAKTVSLRMSQDMFDEYRKALSSVTETRYSEGNEDANRLMEVIARWEGR